jgi:hypothetical protein
MDQLFSSLFDSPGGDPEALICLHTDEANPWSTLQDDAGLWLCCGNKDSAAHLHLPLSEIFAVEYKGLGPVGQFNPSGFCGLATPQQQMYRIVLHTFQKSESNSCKWVPKAFVFGHSNAKDAQEWVQKSQNLLDHDTRRPKRLLVCVLFDFVYHSFDKMSKNS